MQNSINKPIKHKKPLRNTLNYLKNPYFCNPLADMAKLADALDLGSSAARHVGSTPIIRTSQQSFCHSGRIFFKNECFFTKQKTTKNGYSS